MVAKIRVPFWVLVITRHLLFRVPKRTLILTATHMVVFLTSGCWAFWGAFVSCCCLVELLGFGGLDLGSHNYSRVPLKGSIRATIRI